MKGSRSGSLGLIVEVFDHGELQRWAVEDRVRVIDLERDRNAYETAPERAAIETDFYRMPDADGVSPVYWEAWLSQVEGHAASVFKALDTDRPGDIDEEQHQWLALFLATQMTRGRNAREKRHAMLAEELTQVLDASGPENLAPSRGRSLTMHA